MDIFWAHEKLSFEWHGQGVQAGYHGHSDGKWVVWWMVRWSRGAGLLLARSPGLPERELEPLGHKDTKGKDVTPNLSR